jgi:hypothetical protein
MLKAKMSSQRGLVGIVVLVVLLFGSGVWQPADCQPHRIPHAGQSPFSALLEDS